MPQHRGPYQTGDSHVNTQPGFVNFSTKLKHWCLKSDRFPYSGYRFPPDIISYAVWAYHRFCLIFRDVEDLLSERGIIVSYETIRQWCQKFGPEYARTLKRQDGRLGDHWHLDEVFIRINGQQQYLWRALDQDGDVIDILVQPYRDLRAAKRVIRRLLRSGRRTITDHYRPAEKLLSCHAKHLPQCDPQCGAVHQQSSRSFTSVDPATRTANAPIQIREARATFLSLHDAVQNLFEWVGTY